MTMVEREESLLRKAKTIRPLTIRRLILLYAYSLGLLGGDWKDSGKRNWPGIRNIQKTLHVNKRTAHDYQTALNLINDLYSLAEDRLEEMRKTVASQLKPREST